MVEESTKTWADSDSESSSSSSSSSDSEQEEVHCLMADQMADDENFVSNGINLNRGFIYFESAIEEEREDVGATTALLQNYIDYTVHQHRENEQKDEAINRH
ncbi:hypothetical protein F511_33858 [Dorcoceras hygrometricum]|uniref:Uncharacterized protein n=1 Tax=Dorcoceras hygrometricum TaxID=472368 RepID=A0A2Z7D1T0_9LAMI|nr:hypothetical protein F511_33858 [Dorcoceras hygrometricum]